MVRVLYILAITRAINKVSSKAGHRAPVIDSLSAGDTILAECEGLPASEGVQRREGTGTNTPLCIRPHSRCWRFEKQQNEIWFLLYTWIIVIDTPEESPLPSWVLFLELIWVTFGVEIPQPWIHWGLDKCVILVLMCIYSTWCNCSFGAVNTFL